MESIKQNNNKYFELAILFFAYTLLILNVTALKDSLLSAFSAFFGITYTCLAGKGTPKCYFFGLAGSCLYSWLSYTNALWGNLLLYAAYYIPMQIIGFFRWNSNLKKNKNEIIKTKLTSKETLTISLITIFISIICIYALKTMQDTNPLFDGITTIFSITGMYLTVKRAIEQWFVWSIVNGLSAIMWINIILNGTKAYSTVTMWIFYFIFSIYFYYNWKREVV